MTVSRYCVRPPAPAPPEEVELEFVSGTSDSGDGNALNEELADGGAETEVWASDDLGDALADEGMDAL